MWWLRHFRDTTPWGGIDMSRKASEERDGHRSSTVGIHAGSPDPVPGAPVVLPVVQSSTFFGGAGEPAS
jgi:hypothetical protein